MLRCSGYHWYEKVSNKSFLIIKKKKSPGVLSAQSLKKKHFLTFQLVTAEVYFQICVFEIRIERHVVFSLVWEDLSKHSLLPLNNKKSLVILNWGNLQLLPYGLISCSFKHNFLLFYIQSSLKGYSLNFILSIYGILSADSIL